jgi:hypothetical protein
MVLVLLARNPTDTVTYGLLPAAGRLGLEVRMLTDHAPAHRALYAAQHRENGLREPVVESCAVTEVRAVLAALTAGPRPEALLSNSDHLQVQTAQAAAYLGLPGKDWRFALRARDKGLMRAALRTELGLDDPSYLRIRPGDPDLFLDEVSYPAVLKPSEGVASEDVVLVRDRAELELRLEQVRQHRDGDLLIESLLDGPLHTLETLGDGTALRVWGGYRTQVSAAPYFIEERLTWQPARPEGVQDEILRQLNSLGLGFGPCHTEFILTAAGPRIVEVNDRLIGDHGDFLMADLLAEPIFDDVISVHLNAAPRPGPAVPRSRHGLVHSVVAPAEGLLTSAPDRLRRTPPDRPDVQLDYWPIRPAGDRVTLTGTNRDYLGLVRVTGPDDGTVEAATAEFLATERWVIE